MNPSAKNQVTSGRRALPQVLINVGSAMRLHRELGRWARIALACLVGLSTALAGVLVPTPVARAANPQPVQIFFVPLPEDQIRAALYTISTATGTTMRGVVGVSITSNGTVLYYDQWENGYDLDIANPVNIWSAGNTGGTQIWGDGNTTNGDACPLAKPASSCSGDVLSAGAVLVLENNVVIPRNPSTIAYDGRDKLASTKVVAMTKSGWATSPGTVLADAVEAVDTTRWGTSFEIPVGQNLSSSYMFEFISLLVMAAENGTTVQIDKDGNGTTDITTTLNQGESYQVNGGINTNASVTASKPVQVDLITGDIGSSYESRWFSIPPTAQWDDSYYTPVGTTNTTYPANVWLYNPGVSAITVYYETKAGTGSFSVPANSAYRYTMPTQSGAHFYSTNGSSFLAVGTMDSSASGANQTYDWGYTLLSEAALTTALAVGWAPGTSDLSGNGSPVWVTAVRPTTIYVDYDGNPATGPLTDPTGRRYDVTYALTAFESRLIYDPDRDQTGMRVYTLDGTTIMGAWGEDPSKAAAGNPYLDAGYTIPPLPQAVVEKTARVANDPNGNGQLDPGETLQYTITAKNLGVVTFFNTIVSDSLPLEVTYVANSTRFNGAPVADSAAPPAGTIFPLDEGGLNIGNIAVGGVANVTFQAAARPFPPVYTGITNTAEVHAGGDTYIVYLSTPVNPSVITACTLDFTNSGGSPVTVYVENGMVYVQVSDGDRNTDSGTAQTITVRVQDQTTGDYETTTLAETGPNTGIFRGSKPSSTTAGQAPQDGTLYAQTGDTIRASYTDPIFDDSCNDTATIAAPSLVKPLYLGDPSQALDRVDPAATNDTTTASSTVLGSGSAATIAAAATTDGFTSNGTSLTFSHTPGNGDNRLLLVAVGVGAVQTSDTPAGGPVDSVTYGGTPMNLVGSITESPARSYIYSLVNPSPGPANVVVNADSASSIAAGATTFTGVNQTTPLGSFASNSDTTGTTASRTLSSASGELVYSTADWDVGNTPQTIDPGAGQTALWSRNGNYTGAAASTEPGAASVTVSYTSDDDQQWTLAAVPIRPATTSGVISTTFTQTPTMAGNFAMPAGGQVTVTSYISVTSGTPSAPVYMTATLRYGGSTFATLTNPALTSLGGGIYRLVWAGALASNTTVPAGQAVSLMVATGEPGVVFSIFYDSSTYPSKIELPTTTVIDINALGVYDAPYPGGTLLTGATNGQVVYVRSTITDPFGASDITTVTLSIVDPSNTTTTVPLTATHGVSSTAGHKTFEYPWATPSASGMYTITLRADEGTEGIYDTAGTLFNLNFQDTGTPSISEFTTGANGAATNVYDPNELVCVRVTDPDQNTDPAVAETITATVSSSGGDSELVTLTETGPDTGIFTTATCLSASSTAPGAPNDATLYAPTGASLSVTYIDPTDPSDVSSANATVRTLNPAMSLSKSRMEPVDGVATIGELVRFDVAVGNPGPTAITATVTDTFPSACLSYQSASIAPASVITPAIVWNNVGPIPSGGSRTVSVYFRASTACNPATNSVQASALDQNNTPVSAGPASADVIVTRPLLAISKVLIDPPSGEAVVSNTVTFRIDITNTGSTDITNLPLTITTAQPASSTSRPRLPPAARAAASRCGITWAR